MSWALITGASAGIGAATAEALAENKWNVVLTGRREERLASLAQKLMSQYKVKAEFVAMDVRAREDVDRLAKKYASQKIDVLVNNAGLAKGIDKMFNADLEDWDSMIDTNIKGLLYMTRAFLPGMMERKKGHIVNLGSVAGRWVYPSGGVYCATKFAVRALSEGLRMDLLGTPIRVTNVEPGMVETEFSEVRLGNSERAKAVYKGMEPLLARDVAESIAWCVSRPPHMNVQELVLFPTDQAAIGLVHRGE